MLIKSADDKSKRLALPCRSIRHTRNSRSRCLVDQKLICAQCREKISYPEGKFCWNNAKRFGGLQYCREHQGLFA